MHGTGHLRERGASLVEAALVIPLLLLLAATVVDLGRAYFAYITMIDAAREGARYGATLYADPTATNRDAAIRAVVKAEAASQAGVSLSDANIDITTTGAAGSYVRVTVRIPTFLLIMGGLVGRSSIPLSYAAAFRIRCEVGC